LTPADWEHAAQAIRDYDYRFGGVASTSGTETPPKFTFFPMAGNLARDLWRNNYVDLDPTSGIRDWNCRNYSYNGHDAVDVDLRSFGEQRIGVPLFAAEDGIVIAVTDTYFDENNCPNGPCGTPANYVILRHAGGRQTYYWHLKQYSATVAVNDSVVAGQQIGLTGSSGNSSWSHLHLAVYDDIGATLIEPFAGPCRPGESEWVEQPPFNGTLFMRDFGVSYIDPATEPLWPQVMSRTGQIALTDPILYYWFFPYNLPANSTWRTQFERPNGTIAFDSGTRSFGYSVFLRNPWFWHNWNITEMHTTPGTWRILFDINGQRMVEAPIEVVFLRTAEFNHAPEPIGVSLEPTQPTPDDVLICRVDTDQVLDDLDYDIVRYHYVWEVDDVVVRDVTTAGQSDVIARGTAPAGTTVRCTVTPSDGTADGPPASASSAVTACTATDPVAPEASPRGKSRYVSMVPGNSGLQVGIRMTLVDVDGFPGINGSQLWVGPPRNYPEEDSSDPTRTFVGAALQCDPYFTDWGTINVLQVFGAELVPGSTYDVHTVSLDCFASFGAAADFSTPTTFGTGKWGDTAPLYDGDDPGAPQPDFNDIAAVVGKFLADPAAPIKALSQLQPNVVLADRSVNFKDIAAAVSAFLGVTYVDTVPNAGPCACPSSVTCGATSCSTDLVCAPGFCIDGFCTDECGRCTP